MKKIYFLWFLALAVSPVFFSSCERNTDELRVSEETENAVAIDEKESIDKALIKENDSVGKIFVHVCGAVVKSGVYELENGTRAIDAINAAGGFAAGAAIDYVNLAAIVADQEKLYIPTLDEIDSNALNEIGLGKSNNSGKININTADKDELMTLVGVGASRAEAIIEYRSINGAYKKIEDIMQISGIKKALFDKIKDKISVN